MKHNVTDYLRLCCSLKVFALFPGEIMDYLERTDMELPFSGFDIITDE